MGHTRNGHVGPLPGRAHAAHGHTMQSGHRTAWIPTERLHMHQQGLRTL